MILKAFILFNFSLFMTLGCGVKGRPLPPETPREIGIGKPLYKGVDQELKDDKKKEKAKQ